MQLPRIDATTLHPDIGQESVQSSPHRGFALNGRSRTRSRQRLRSGIALGIAFSVLALGGCSSDDENANAQSGSSTTSTQEEGEAIEVPAPGSRLSAEEFQKASELPNTVLLDVRTPEEFTEGHIPGALNLNVDGENFAEDVANLDPEANYAIYCRSGRRSQIAMDEFARQGPSSYYDLKDGIQSWVDAGYPVQSPN